MNSSLQQAAVTRRRVPYDPYAALVGQLPGFRAGSAAAISRRQSEENLAENARQFDLTYANALEQRRLQEEQIGIAAEQAAKARGIQGLTTAATLAANYKPIAEGGEAAYGLLSKAAAGLKAGGNALYNLATAPTAAAPLTGAAIEAPALASGAAGLAGDAAALAGLTPAQSAVALSEGVPSLALAARIPEAVAGSAFADTAAIAGAGGLAGDAAALSGLPASQAAIAASEGVPALAAPTTGMMAAPLAAGFISGSIAESTGLGEWFSDNMPFGGTSDWSSALGAAAGIGLAAALALGPVGWVLGGLGGLFCFTAGTPIRMQNGPDRAVEDLDIGDAVLMGGDVLGVGKVLADDLCRYDGVCMQKDHAVFEDGRWIRVRASARSQRLSVEGPVVVYPVITREHLLVVGKRIFADLCETDQGLNATDEERLACLNGDAQRNRRLREAEHAL